MSLNIALSKIFDVSMKFRPTLKVSGDPGLPYGYFSSQI
jgi:hypothetical protein